MSTNSSSGLPVGTTGIPIVSSSVSLSGSAVGSTSSSGFSMNLQNPRRLRNIILSSLLVAMLVMTMLFMTSGDPLVHQRLLVGRSADIVESRRYLYDTHSTELNFVLVSDPDTASAIDKARTNFQAILKSGKLIRKETGKYEVELLADSPIQSKMNEGGRGMELSELVFFNNMLLTGDDRTGIVFEIKDGKAFPRYILAEGDSYSSKGFKIEWATVKDGFLYIGSQGREYIDPQTQKVLSLGNLWVKVIDSRGQIRHMDWTTRYNKLRAATGTSFPGYLIHEAVCWNDVYRRWYFFPRRESTEPYDEELDIRRGTNLVITADDSFDNIASTRIGPLDHTERGFSTCKFLPNNPSVVLLVRSEETPDSKFQSFITLFDVDRGTVLLDDYSLGGHKFEGVEFL